MVLIEVLIANSLTSELQKVTYEVSDGYLNSGSELFLLAIRNNFESKHQDVLCLSIAFGSLIEL